jgi:transposase
LSQKELQRVAVVTSCVKGDLACARAAALLNVNPRHVKRLKSRLRQGTWVALAHASRGRPSARRLPDRVRDRILHLARTTYDGFNDHHRCEKLVEKEGFSIGRETLRRLLRSAGIGSPRKRRAPTHRQHRLARAREGEMVMLDASLHRWLEDRGPQLTVLGFLNDATRKVLVAEFFPIEDARGYFRLLQRLLGRFGIPLSFCGDRHSVFVFNDHWTVEEQLVGRRQPTQFGRALEQLGITYIAARSPQAKGGVARLWGTFQDRLTSELRLAGPTISSPPTKSCAAFCRTTIGASVARRAKPKPLGGLLPKTSTTSAASIMNAWPATTTSWNGTDDASKSRPNLNTSASLVPRCSSMSLWKERFRSITQIISHARIASLNDLLNYPSVGRCRLAQSAFSSEDRKQVKVPWVNNQA